MLIHKQFLHKELKFFQKLEVHSKISLTPKYQMHCINNDFKLVLLSH